MPSDTSAHLLVSVMPKEFRGREGLLRKTFAPSGGAEASKRELRSAPVDIPKPKVQTPAQTVGAGILPPPPKRRAKVSRLVLAIGAVVLLGLSTGAVVLMRSLSVPEPAPPIVATTPPPVPVTTPPVVVAPPVVVLPPAPPTSPFGDGVYPGKDTDSDGLTDIEEALYGSNPLRPDTDGDAHIDGNEVHNLYHPNGRDPMRLVDAGLVQRVAPTDFSYSLDAITAWRRSIRAEGRQVLVHAPTGEVLQVVTQAIDPVQSIADWYQSQTPVAARVVLESDRTKQGFVMAWTDDHLTAYVRLTDDELVVFTYQLGDRDRVEYRQTFEMMINSLERAAQGGA